MNRLKEINYRGVLKFNIPFDWIEDYDDFDGGTFYEDNPVSGTMRVKLTTLKKPNGENTLSSTVLLNDIIPNGSESELLPNNNAFKMFYEQTTESNQDITIYYWYLLQNNNPEITRLVNFSYTILNHRLGVLKIQNEIELMTYQIKNAEFQN